MINVEGDPGRPIEQLLKQYRTPQKGESDTARTYTKKEQRLYERLNYGDYVCKELGIKHLKQQTRYLICKQPRLKDLYKNIAWETTITAIAFYVKCHYTKTNPNHLMRYKICKENGLTLQIYNTIITRLKHVK